MDYSTIGSPMGNHECNFVEEQEPDGRLILGPCIECGIPAAEAMKEFSTTKELLRETQDNRNKAWSTVTALEQKLLASEVSGGELQQALKDLYSELVESNSPRCDEWSTPANIIKQALSKSPSHYSSQVEAIGKMVEALATFAEQAKYHKELEKDNGRKLGICANCSEDFPCAFVRAAEILTTWNSIKGETEGKA